jgi:benzoate transport
MNPVQTIIDDSSVRPLQAIVFVLCFLLNVIDGMDVLIISFTAPGIATEWNVAAATLGVVFSAGLFGMMLGALLLAPFADAIGRRNLIMVSVTIIAISTWWTAYSGSLAQLIALRVISGLGIGALLASAATMTAEYAPDRRRNVIVSLCLAGYPIGAAITGAIAAEIIPEYGWRTMYIFAGAMTTLMLPLVFFGLPESLSFLLEKQPRHALDKLNRILKRMQHPVLHELPARTAQARRGPRPTALFSPDLRRRTTLLWFAFFMSFVTLFFLTSWIPKLSQSMGLPLELAIYAGAVFNLGGAFGITLQGMLSQRFGLQRSIFTFLLGTALLMLAFGFFDRAWVLPVFCLLGFLMQGGFSGLYVIAARLYPTLIRNTGIGWAIGAGRTGAIAGPVVGGLLIGTGLSIAGNFIVFAGPVALAGVAILTIRLQSNESPVASSRP